MRNLSSTEQLILTCTSVLILFTTALTWFASPPFREQTTASSRARPEGHCVRTPHAHVITAAAPHAHCTQPHSGHAHPTAVLDGTWNAARERKVAHPRGAQEKRKKKHYGGERE